MIYNLQIFQNPIDLPLCYSHFSRDPFDLATAQMLRLLLDACLNDDADFSPGWYFLKVLRQIQ